MADVQETLAERGKRYGDFRDHAEIAQAIKAAMYSAGGCGKWGALPDMHKQALETIADKIARILNGDPNYADNWHDIQGYARLVEERLPSADTSAVSFDAAAVLGAPGEQPEIGPDWVEWDGAHVRPRLGLVEVEMRSGRRLANHAELLNWKLSGAGDDIVRYRQIPER